VESDAKTSDNHRQVERDHKGRFVPGNTLGKDHLFTKHNQPANRGRPKTKIVTKQLEKWLGRKARDLPMAEKLAKKIGVDAGEATVAEVFGLSMIDHSMKGKDGMVKETLRRVEGEVPKSIAVDSVIPVDVWVKYMDAMTYPPAPDARREEDEGESGSVVDG
jgi:hypothetical protein